MAVHELTDEQVKAYLHRLGIARSDVTADFECLAALQLAHLERVPFDNLDVYYRRPVRPDLDWSLSKILRGRGGWCFELNGAFSALLRSVGFEVDRLSALVLMSEQRAPMDDHLCLRVRLDEAYLVDVGFGESFTAPLRLDATEPAFDERAGRRFRIVDAGDRRQLESEQANAWRVDYRFADEPRELSFFRRANDHLATTPGLMWTEKRFSTRLTPDGRETLLNDRLKTTPLKGDEQVHMLDDEQWRRVLDDRFAGGGP